METYIDLCLELDMDPVLFREKIRIHRNETTGEKGIWSMSIQSEFEGFQLSSWFRTPNRIC